MGRAARRAPLTSPLPLSLLQRSREPPSRNTPPFSLGRSRPCADQTNFTRLSPGVGCCFRTHSLALFLSPFLRSSQLLPLPSTTLPFSFLSVSAFLSHSSAYGARSETPLPSFSRVSPTRCCVRAVKYA